MLTPLYLIDTAPQTVTVASPGALANATTVPVTALTAGLPNGYMLDFGTSHYAKLTGAANKNAVALAVQALPLALTAGMTATVPGNAASALLSDKYTKKSPAEQLALHLVAEQLLDLRAPALTGNDGEELAFAVVLQVNYLLQRGDEPLVKESIANGNPSLSTTFRDRYVNPDAAAIVTRVTGRQQVRFTVPLAGV